MIKIVNLSKTFNSGENSFNALSDFSLSISDGEFIAVVGKSGSGKSTLLNIIGTIDRLSSGEIFVNGKKLSNMKNSQQAKYRNTEIGFIFQSFHLEPSYSVYKNVELPLLIANTGKKERSKKVLSALIQVGLESKMKNKACNLSGGEKQRVCIARALVNDPGIILADEPCGNLDSFNSAIIMNILKTLAKSGKTIILVTHNMEDAKMADRIIEVKDGKLMTDDK